MIKERQIMDTIGAGGSGKSGGSGGTESPDTLVVNEIVKIVHALGEGELSLYTGDGQSIFLNNIPLVNSDGSFNFGNYNETTGDSGLYTGAGATYWEFRSGAPSQTVMTNPAFPSASAIFSVGAQATGGTSVPLVAPSPVIYSVSSSAVNYCKVAVSFPNGIEDVDSNGNIVGDSVEIALDVKEHSSSTWTNVFDDVIEAKSSNEAIIQFQVNQPVAGQLWDIRMRRVTQDNSTTTRKNQCYLYDVEEVQAITLPYNGIALVGLALDAATIGGAYASIPAMSFLLQGLTVQIPSNYNPNTRAYTGTWNGTFTTGVTSNPAWILYDMITNSQYGAGLYGILPAQVDKYSFYNAAVFNDGGILYNNDGSYNSGGVPDGNGGYEARFTWNAVIQNRQDMLTTFQQVAEMMNASLGMENGLITLYQDRPQSSQYLVTKANCIGSDSTSPSYFTYSSSAQPSRTTAFNVSWTNPTNVQFLPTATSVKDSVYEAKYGYQSQDVAALGATTQGQAIRYGKYQLYKGQYTPGQVRFNVGLEGFFYRLNDVFDLFDDDLAQTATSGRIVSATSNTVVLDQPVTITGTGSTISVWLQDGVTYETHSITNTAGTYSTLTISGTWTTTPTQYCVYGVKSATSPAQYRITNLAYDDVTKVVTVTANQYGNAYTYVEYGYTIPTPVYTLPSQVSPQTPTSLTSVPSQYIDTTTKTVAYAVTINWARPTVQNTGYIVKWRKDNGPYTTTAQFQINSFELNVVNGTYDFLVYAVNLAGNMSAPASISYTQSNVGGSTSSVLTEITGLYVTNTTGTAWTGLDLPITWTNPAANQGLLKDFVVSFHTTGGTLLRQVVVDGVPGGSTQNCVYSYAMNQADTSGDPVRSVVVKVQGQDSSNNTTTGISATLTNAAPAVPSNITSTPVQQSCIITWTPDTGIDVSGYMVWYSTTSGFTPGPSNVIDCGNTAIASLPGLAKNTTYYFIVGAYDVWGKSTSGTGMNLSSQLTFTTPSSVGISSGSSLPTSGMTAGDTFYDTANSTLYTYNGSAWIPAGVLSVSSLPASGTTGQLVLLTTTNVLYQWNGSSWSPISVPANSVTGTLTAAQIASITAAQVTGQITTTQITNNAITTPLINSGAVVSASIAAGTIVSSNIAASTITGSNIAAATITGTNIAAATINTGNMVAGSITSGLISAGAITTSLLAAGAVTASTIASSTITGGNIAASTITASNLNVATLSAISANVGTLTAGTISNNSGTNTINLSATGSSAFISTPNLSITAAGSATFSGTLSGAIVNAGNISVSSLAAINANLGAVTAGTLTFTSSTSYTLYNNGTQMMVSGVGFGASSNYLQWFGPTQSSASNFAACTDALAKFYLKTDGSAYFGGKLSPIITRTYYYTNASFTESVPYGVTSCTILAYGGGGGGACSYSSSHSTGGGGGGGMCQTTIAVTAGQTFTCFVAGGGLGGAGPPNNTVVNSGSAGGNTTVSGTVAGGTVSMTANGGAGGTSTAGGAGGGASGGTTVNLSGSAGTFAAVGLGGASATGGGSYGKGGNGDDTDGTGGGGQSGYLYFSYN